MTFFLTLSNVFCIIKDRQAIVFLDTFFAPLSLLHSCPRNLYEVIRTLLKSGWVAIALLVGSKVPGLEEHKLVTFVCSYPKKKSLP